MILRPVVLASSLVLLAAGVAWGATADKRPNAWGYKYPASLDAEVSAGQVHQVHYQDAHIMLMEVSNPSGFKMTMHGHPYPSVFARDTAAPNPNQGALSGETFMDPKSPRNGQNWGPGGPPKGAKFPTCATADPEDPHLPQNNSGGPIHFFRVEFKTFDGPGAAKAYSGRPERKILYKTDGMRLVEVTLQPGKAEAVANRLPAVIATDTDAAFRAVLAAAGQGAGSANPPKGMTAPRCVTTGAGMGAPVRNDGKDPLHFYRVEYLRVDGDGLKDHWRAWYPHMVEMMKK